MTQAPENTLVGNLHYSLNLLKGGIRSTTYYEINSGLELTKEFIYVEVPAGQGMYKWVDANNNGVKDNGEFVEAINPDEAIFIRIWIPSNNYQTVFSNRFTQTLLFKPKSIWKNAKGFSGFLTRFWDQAQFSSFSKMDDNNGFNFMNPFNNNLEENILTQNLLFNNKLHFNTLSSLFSASYSYRNSNANALLAGGRETSLSTEHKATIRFNIKDAYLFIADGFKGKNGRSQTYLGAQNYLLNINGGTIGVTYQPSTAIQIQFQGLFREKRNVYEHSNEYTKILEAKASASWQAMKKGQLLAKVSYLNITYNSETSTTLAYIMLESLKPGNNLTWELNAQFKLGNNLQINVGYSGRSSENTKVVNTGTAEVRMYF